MIWFFQSDFFRNMILNLCVVIIMPDNYGKKLAYLNCKYVTFKFFSHAWHKTEIFDYFHSEVSANSAYSNHHEHIMTSIL